MTQVSMRIGAVRERIAELEEMVDVDDSWLTSADRVAQLEWAMEELHDQRQLLEELVEQHIGPCSECGGGVFSHEDDCPTFTGHPNNHF